MTVHGSTSRFSGTRTIVFRCSTSLSSPCHSGSSSYSLARLLRFFLPSFYNGLVLVVFADLRWGPGGGRPPLVRRSQRGTSSRADTQAPHPFARRHHARVGRGLYSTSFTSFIEALSVFHWIRQFFKSHRIFMLLFVLSCRVTALDQVEPSFPSQHRAGRCVE